MGPLWRDKVGIVRKSEESEAKGTYLLLRDVELVPFQHHIAVFPNLPENPFPAEFPDPADLLGWCRLMISILRPLRRGRGKKGRLGDHSFSFLSTPSLETLLRRPLPFFPGSAQPKAGVREPLVRSPLPKRSLLGGTLSRCSPPPSPK